MITLIHRLGRKTVTTQCEDWDRAKTIPYRSIPLSYSINLIKVFAISDIFAHHRRNLGLVRDVVAEFFNLSLIFPDDPSDIYHFEFSLVSNKILHVQDTLKCPIVWNFLDV